MDDPPPLLERHWFASPLLPVTKREKCFELAARELRNMSPPLAHSWMSDPVRFSTNISIDMLSSLEVFSKKWKESAEPQMSVVKQNMVLMRYILLRSK